MISGKKGLSVGNVMMLIGLTTIVILAWGIMVEDFELQYVETNISSSDNLQENFTSNAVNSSTLNETFYDTQQSFRNIGEASGFFDVTGEGLVALPTIFIDFIVGIAKLINLTNSQILFLLKFLNIAVPIVTMIVVLVMIWFVFKFIDQLRRYPV